ncbi:MAG: thiazole synthase, partial [Muribaculaceae bacterium]|nr:thiazole synthase [Muribaculaceae bacterium]
MGKLIIGRHEFSSRLFMGTGKFSSNQLMSDAIEASGTQMVTVALKRLDTENRGHDDMLRHINREHVQFLPNTSGVRTAEE